MNEIERIKKRLERLQRQKDYIIGMYMAEHNKGQEDENTAEWRHRTKGTAGRMSGEAIKNEKEFWKGYLNQKTLIAKRAFEKEMKSYDLFKLSDGSMVRG